MYGHRVDEIATPPCVECLKKHNVCACVRNIKKVRHSTCCKGPVCEDCYGTTGGTGLPIFCKFCKTTSGTISTRKTSFGENDWILWFNSAKLLSDWITKPYKRSFIMNTSEIVEWRDPRPKLFNDYLSVLLQMELALAFVFRENICSRIFLKRNDQQFGLAFNRLTKLVLQYRQIGGCIKKHRYPIRFHSGFVAMCAMRITKGAKTNRLAMILLIIRRISKMT